MANLMDSIRRDVPELMRSYDPEALATMISESRAATAPTSGETRTARESGSMCVKEGMSPTLEAGNVPYSALVMRRQGPVSPSKSNYVLRAAAQRTAKEARVREAEEAFRLQTQVRSHPWYGDAMGWWVGPRPAAQPSSSPIHADGGDCWAGHPPTPFMHGMRPDS